MPPSSRDSNSASDVATERAFAEAAAVCKRRWRGLYLAGAFLPQPKRSAFYAIQAFFGLLLDALPTSESDCSGNSFASRLALMGEKIDDVYAQAITLPRVDERDESQHILEALSQTVRNYQVPRGHWQDLIEGFQATNQLRRLPTWASLDRYCYQTGSALALIRSCVLGLTHSEAHLPAMALGKAIRLTEIISRIGDDYRNGRIYLPLEDMARCRYSERDLAGNVINDAFHDLVRFEVKRARDLFQQAADGMCWLGGDRERMTTAVTIIWHGQLLQKFESRDFDPLNSRVSAPGMMNPLLIAKAWSLVRRANRESLHQPV